MKEENNKTKKNVFSWECSKEREGGGIEKKKKKNKQN